MSVMQRNMVGYGEHPPKVEWPDGARIAVSIVVNYEEGSEATPAYGDPTHELIGEMNSNKPPQNRDMQTESQWEYGSRAGVWRLLRILEQEGVKSTFYVCAMALEQNPHLGPRITQLGHDVCGHGLRWTDQWQLDHEAEKETIHQARVIIEKMTGQRPLGWFTRGGPSANTRDILAEEGFLYDCDGLNDDLPYYSTALGKPFLIVPYAFDSNDGKYWRAGWNDGQQFFQYLKDSFDLLYAEGETHPKMFTVGLHTRVSGRPGRAAVVAQFLRYVKQHPRVWLAGRDDIARWWLEHYPPQ
jgi:allantoinase